MLCTCKCYVAFLLPNKYFSLRYLKCLTFFRYLQKTLQDKYSYLKLMLDIVYCQILSYILEVFLNAFAKGLAKLLLKTLCDGIMNKDMNK